MLSKRTAWIVVLIGLSGLASEAALGDDAGGSPLELFEHRIMPIFNSPHPSSCVQCHLSSVDLKDYILPSSDQTFASLRDQGLINVDAPEQSKILTLIAMGEQDADRGAQLIHAKTRQAEYDAFRAWLIACCSDERLRRLEVAAKTSAAGPQVSGEVIRHNRKDRILDSFTRNIWSQRMRCFPCHTPGELEPSNPKHKKPAERYREYVAQYGQRMNLFRETPQATLRALIASSRKRHGNQLPLLNLQEPTQSLLIVKPTSKLPAKRADGQFETASSQPPVTHMGGLKMHVDDMSYKAFVSWIADYAQVVHGQYTSADQLPLDNWHPSGHVLRIKDAPEVWPSMATVQLFVYAMDTKNGGWSTAPIAFTQCKVTPRKMAVGSLMLMAASEDPVLSEDPVAEPEDEDQAEGETARLAAGRYLIRAYLDTEDQLSSDPTALLHGGESHFQAVVDAQWKEGFQHAEIVLGSAFIN